MKNGRRIATIVVLLSGGALLAYCGLRIVSRHCYPASVFYDVGKFYTDFSDGTLQVVNLGSTTGKYAFDWSDTNVKGGNFATAPQCGTYDFALLRTYRRFLAPEAIVLITMCPFSNICPKDYPMPRKDRFAKYYALLNGRDMTFFSRKEAVKVWLSLNVGHWIWLKGFPSDTSLDDSRGSMQEMRRCTADRLKRLWMKQFNIENLTLPVPDVDEKDLVWNVGVYQRMIDWCISCGFRPVLISPPLSHEFDDILSDSFLNNYVYGFVRKIDRVVPYYDYIRDPRFRTDEESYFMDGFRLSKNGRKVFTQLILDRLRTDGLLERSGND